MTDARLPGRWLIDPKMDGLSDRAWRSFTGSLMYCNEQGTDGAIEFRALRYLHPDGVDDVTAAELVKAHLWTRGELGFLVSDWDKTQSTAADVEHQRERNRKKAAAHRARERSKVLSSSSVPRDVTGYVTEDVGQDRTGKDRTGKALDDASSRVTDWPTARPGEGRRSA